MKKTIIGTAIILMMGWILKNGFYKALCSINKFGCFVGWITFKSPIIILTILVSISLYLYLKKKN